MILIQTLDPARLLNQIYKAIDEKKVKTWKYDKDKDFLWCPNEGNWYLNAYFTPEVETINNVKYLKLRLYTFKNKSIRTEDFAAYHGYFAQMILTHFGSENRIIHMFTVPVKDEDNVVIKNE